MSAAWVKWFDEQDDSEKRSIALAAIEKLIADNKVKFSVGDTVDKFGDPIDPNAYYEEHLYWNDEHKEDLRVPF